MEKLTEACNEMIYDMYIFALYKKEKRDRDGMSNSQKLWRMRNGIISFQQE